MAPSAGSYVYHSFEIKKGSISILCFNLVRREFSYMPAMAFYLFYLFQQFKQIYAMVPRFLTVVYSNSFTQ